MPKAADESLFEGESEHLEFVLLKFLYFLGNT